MKLLYKFGYKDWPLLRDWLLLEVIFESFSLYYVVVDILVAFLEFLGERFDSNA